MFPLCNQCLLVVSSGDFVTFKVAGVFINMEVVTVKNGNIFRVSIYFYKWRK
jgi:hypothetical protein